MTPAPSGGPTSGRDVRPGRPDGLTTWRIPVSNSGFSGARATSMMATSNIFAAAVRPESSRTAIRRPTTVPTGLGITITTGLRWPVGSG